MTDNGFAYRGVLLFFLVNAVMFGALCNDILVFGVGGQIVVL